jgi:hypothetical protein
MNEWMNEWRAKGSKRRAYVVKAIKKMKWNWKETKEDECRSK